MTDPTFAIDVYRGARTAHVVCSGELDVCATGRLRAALACAAQSTCRSVIFNGAGITLLTADAVDALTDAAFACRMDGVNFEVILGDRGRSVVELLGVAGVLLGPAPEVKADERFRDRRPHAPWVGACGGRS